MVITVSITANFRSRAEEGEHKVTFAATDLTLSRCATPDSSTAWGKMAEGNMQNPVTASSPEVIEKHAISLSLCSEIASHESAIEDRQCMTYRWKLWKCAVQRKASSPCG